MRKVLPLIILTFISLGVWSAVSANVTIPASERPQAQQKNIPEPKRPCKSCPTLHSGFFVGLKGSYAWSKGKINENSQATATSALISSQRADLSIDGSGIGLFLGYDHYFPNKWVLGIEGGAQWANLSGEINGTYSIPNQNAISNIKTRLQSDLTTHQF